MNLHCKTCKHQHSDIRLLHRCISIFIAVSPSSSLCLHLHRCVSMEYLHHNQGCLEGTYYIITWLGISNSFWNSLIYGVMNKKFRQAAAQTACYTWVCSKRVAGNTSESNDDRDDKRVPAYGKCMNEQKISGHVADMK